MTGKSWVFWLGLLVFAVGAFEVLTVTQYIPLSNYGYIAYDYGSQLVVGIAFVLSGLNMMYSGRNKPGGSAETILF